jgi:hypothetical protein
MTYQKLICPRCRRLLTVSDAAPAVVTCPGCLARIERASAEAPPQRVLPVIPVDAQADRDGRIAIAVLWTIGALVCAGVVMMAVRSGVGGGLPCVVLGFGGVALLVLFLRSKRSEMLLSGERTVAAPPLPTAQPVPGRPGVLEYNAPPRLSPAKAQAMSMAAFAGGFFAAIIVCGLGFFVLAITADNGPGGSHSVGAPIRALYLGVVVAAVVATAVFAGMLNARPGWRGFGPGSAVGLGLGMLALGPCAFCYLLFALQ